MSGTLYVVATPIGNLEDMTFRAVRVLREAAVVACEDTRHSRKLLEHYAIGTPTVSYYREREAERAAELLERLAAGEDVALLSDAGAPLVSDPGARLVEAALAAGAPVVPVPGASALTTALMGGGAAADAEHPVAFLGFLPARSGARRRWLEEFAGWTGQVVMFESPHRLRAALEEMEEIWGPERTLVAGRELTKLHEEFVRGTVASVRAHFAAQEPRGEFTLVAGPAVERTDGTAGTRAAEPPQDPKELKRWAREQGLSRPDAYRRWQARYTVKS